MRKIKSWVIVGMMMGGFVGSCGDDPSPFTPTNAVVSSASLYEMSDEVLVALKNKDWETAAAYFHPTEGVRFSPYSYINTVSDVCLTADEFLELVKKKNILVWGEMDGTGDTIRLDIENYINRFVLDKNYDTVTDRTLNNYVHHGSSLDNLSEIYPQADVVEYYVPGSEEFAQMDWGQLKLVFKMEDYKYYLIAIIRNVWTT